MTKTMIIKLNRNDLETILNHHFQNMKNFDSDFIDKNPTIAVSNKDNCEIIIEVIYTCENVPGILAKKNIK
jgi:hypothetical protein